MSKWVWVHLFASLSLTLGTSAASAQAPSPAPVVLMAPATPSPAPPAPPPDATARQAQEAQCTDRNGAACFTLGTIYRDGTGVPQARTMANSYFRRACALGHEAGCSALNAPAATQIVAATRAPVVTVALQNPQRRPLTAAEIAESLTTLSNACLNYRVAVACLAAGSLRTAVDGPLRDRTEARRLLTRGCDLRDADSCALLATLEQAGEAGLRDQAAAQRHQPRALEIERDNRIAAQLATGVQSLSASAATSTPQTSLHRRTQEALQPYIPMAQGRPMAAVLEQRCGEADQRACVLFGAALLEGDQRNERGEALVKTGCDTGDTLACLYLGWAQFKREDFAAARLTAENACTRNDGFGCTLYAAQLAVGMGGPADLPRAQEMAQRAIQIDFTDQDAHAILAQIRQMSSTTATPDR